MRSIDVGLTKELQYSTVHRLAIEYHNAEGPRTLFLKLCPPGHGGEGKEVEFYNRIAPRSSCPPLIKCYDAVYANGHSHILMEDLFETHSQPEQNTAPSEELSRRAIEALAEFHATWWNRPDLGNGLGELLAGERLAKFIQDLNMNVRRFLKIAELSPEQEQVYDRMLAAADRIWGRLSRPIHLTVTHGDMHWWNFLFPRDPDNDSVHVFDWHLWHIDLGARDLAFLLALGGFAEPRPEIEQKLLRAYHQTLGVPNYSWEMLLEDYRWSAIRNLNMPVIFWSQGKHESTVRDALRRAYEAYERLECGKLIS